MSTIQQPKIGRNTSEVVVENNNKGVVDMKILKNKLMDMKTNGLLSEEQYNDLMDSAIDKSRTIEEIIEILNAIENNKNNDDKGEMKTMMNTEYTVMLSGNTSEIANIANILNTLVQNHQVSDIFNTEVNGEIASIAYDTNLFNPETGVPASAQRALVETVICNLLNDEMLFEGICPSVTIAGRTLSEERRNQIFASSYPRLSKPEELKRDLRKFFENDIYEGNMIQFQVNLVTGTPRILTLACFADPENIQNLANSFKMQKKINNTKNAMNKIADKSMTGLEVFAELANPIATNLVKHGARAVGSIVSTGIECVAIAGDEFTNVTCNIKEDIVKNGKYINNMKRNIARLTNNDNKKKVSSRY